MTKMTSMERRELQGLIRQKARLMKAQAAQRGRELIAEFEQQLNGHFNYDQDEIWKEAFEEAEKVARESQARVHARCRELGIPDKFAPSVNLSWWRSGQNALKDLRADMRREAKIRIAVLEAAAKTDIERFAVEAQEELVAEGLTTEAAQMFLTKLPSAESLMPILELDQVTQGVLELEHQKKQHFLN